MGADYRHRGHTLNTTGWLARYSLFIPHRWTSPSTLFFSEILDFALSKVYCHLTKSDDATANLTTSYGSGLLLEKSIEISRLCLSCTANGRVEKCLGSLEGTGADVSGSLRMRWCEKGGHEWCFVCMRGMA